MSYQVRIEKFEGPLDLLLHLIRKNEMDIYDIPMAEITDQYLIFLDAMKSLNLDIAGEFLLMAATLMHIKSKMLLPPAEDETADEEEEEDPRAELVRRLLEYQKYKDAAVTLDAYPLLERDVFCRDPFMEESDQEEGRFEEVGIDALMEALRGLLKETADEKFHEVTAERLSVTDRINRILFLLTGRESLDFREIFSERPDRHEVVVSFLAMLELVKMRLIRLGQSSRFGPLWLLPAAAVDELESPELDEESLGYG